MGVGARGWSPSSPAFRASLSYFVKAFVGPGCLSFPLAYQRSGVVLGSTLVLFLGFTATLNMVSMLRLRRHYESQPGAHTIVTYADLAGAVWGPGGKRLVETLINLMQLGVCSVYFDFVAENIQPFLGHGPLASITMCTFYIYPVFLGLAMLPSVRSIAPFTGLANALILIPIAIVLYMAMLTLSTDGVGEGVVLAKPLSSPRLFAIAVYGFAGIANLFPVENALAEGNQREGIHVLLYITMALVCTIYMFIGLVGHLAWPATSSGSITAELAKTIGGPLIGASSFMVMVSVILTFPVQLFPAVELLESRLVLDDNEHMYQECRQQEDVEGDAHDATVTSVEDAAETMDRSSVGAVPPPSPSAGQGVELRPGKTSPPKSRPPDTLPSHPSPPQTMPMPPPEHTELLSMERVCLRLAVVTGTGLVSLLVPDLEALISIIGAVAGTLLAVVLPACFHLRTFGKDRASLNYFVAIVGIGWGTWGTLVIAFGPR